MRLLPASNPDHFLDPPPSSVVDLRPLEITQFKVPQLPLKGGGDSSSSNAVDEEEEDAKAVGHVDTVEPVGMEETVDKPRAHKDKVGARG